MGNLLESPITTKDSHSLELNGLSVGISGMQGWRTEMEDAHTAVALQSKPEHTLVGVFDGHGGQFAALYSAEHLSAVLERRPEWQEYVQGTGDDRPEKQVGDALTQAFLELDEELRTKPEVERSGCTAVAAVITPTFIMVANAGDSRCVLGTQRLTKPMSEDHKPTLDSERERIEAAGGTVSWKRVDGDLAVSRAIGDFGYKTRTDLPPERQKVTALPDIRVHMRSPKDEVLLLACDGVWDVMENEESLELLRTLMSEGERDASRMCEEVLDQALEKGSRDNISACIVTLPGAAYGRGGGVMARREQRQRAKESEERRKEKDMMHAAGDGSKDQS
mmetsp:Transcript_8577/g.29212  ORF Transcript_8577/g.29212 Transcript_8577/m.29212 type:complete len:335 (+) Transcript_8577:165-1169(+)